MRYFIALLFIFSIAFNFNSISYAQESEMDQELSDEEYLSDDDFSDDYLSDDEELDYETDDFVETNDDLDDLSDSPQQAQNSAGEESVMSDSDNVPQSMEEVDIEIEEGEDGEISFKTADNYDSFGAKSYNWGIYLHYGFEFASTSDSFSSSIPLPKEYSDIGLDIYKHFTEKPYFAGFRLQVMTESAESSTLVSDYSMKLITALAGYKFIDDIVSVSGTLGLVYPLSADVKVSTVSGSGTPAEKSIDIGLSYTVGVVSVIKLKRFHLGFDGGMLYLKSQKIDDEDFDQNVGGYFRLLLGLAF